MRKSFHNKHIIADTAIFYGVSLGYDFTSEHEWGTKKMKAYFGIDTSKMGVDGRSITKGNVFFAQDNDMCVLTSREPYDKKSAYTTKDLLAYDIQHMSEKFECAWDENNFCIATKNKNEFSMLHELYEAFQKNNIVISFIKSEMNAFANSSLCVLIKDRLPQQIKDDMMHVDKKSIELTEYEKKIGVAELKKKKGLYKGEKYFLACSPKWIDYEDAKHRDEKKKEMNTEYDIMFWINYSDDDDNFGYYTAEEIIKWLSTPGLKLKGIRKQVA